MTEKFKSIEANYDVENIRYRGEQVWSYLRTAYYWKSLENVTNEYSNSKKESFLKKLYKMIKQSCYGFKSWFKRYDNLVFSDVGERININNQYIDKSFERLSELENKDEFLFIESTSEYHYSRNKVPTKNIVSYSMILLIFGFIIKLQSLFVKKIITIDQLEQINKENDLNVNYQKIILDFALRKNLMKIMFKIYRPKVIYLICYYCKETIIKAAKELNIQVIEVQHGLIGANHFAYNLNKELSTLFFPDILLTFGKHDKYILEHNKFKIYKNIYSVGSYGLELIKTIDTSLELIEIISNYHLSISVSTQYTVEDTLAEFIKVTAASNPNICFLLSLRQYDQKYYEKFDLPKNVYLFKDNYSCYEIIKSCDIHLTAYSTCAIEALFFIKKVILVDINGYASKFINSNISNSLYFIQNQIEFNEAICSKILHDDVSFYKSNYDENISLFLHEVHKKEIIS